MFSRILLTTVEFSLSQVSRRKLYPKHTLDRSKRSFFFPRRPLRETLGIFPAKLAELNDTESRKCHLNCSHDISCSAAAMAVRFDVDTEDRSGALWDTGGPTNLTAACGSGRG